MTLPWIKAIFLSPYWKRGHGNGVVSLDQKLDSSVQEACAVSDEIRKYSKACERKLTWKKTEIRATSPLWTSYYMDGGGEGK